MLVEAEPAKEPQVVREPWTERRTDVFLYGILYAAISFPFLAPLGVSENAHTCVVIFIRTFSYTLRVAISLTVMQSTLSKHVLPAFMIELFPPHQDPVPLSSSSPSSARRAAGVCSVNCGDMGVIAGIVGARLVSCDRFSSKAWTVEKLQDAWNTKSFAEIHSLDILRAKPSTVI
ncbi:hypothetical protein K439DRAFT_1620600 [Ramaria rubella]|nr:hypothetical protein K439DRAFT_1620600 [Ramaria rubella]